MWKIIKSTDVIIYPFVSERDGQEYWMVQLDVEDTRYSPPVESGLYSSVVRNVSVRRTRESAVDARIELFYHYEYRLNMDGTINIRFDPSQKK